jgi:hypothetical protein
MSDVRMFLIRRWLIRKLAGKRSVILNVRLEEGTPVQYTNFPILGDGVSIQFTGKTHD